MRSFCSSSVSRTEVVDRVAGPPKASPSDERSGTIRYRRAGVFVADFRVGAFLLGAFVVGG